MDSSIEDSPVVSRNKQKKTLNFDSSDSDESVHENDTLSDSDARTRNISTDLVIPASDNEESELESSELRNSESGDSDKDSESGDAEVGGSESGDDEVGGSESGGDEVGDSESGDDEAGDSESGDDEAGDSESEDTEAGDSDQADLKPSSPNSSSGESVVGQSPVLASFKPAKSSNLLRKSLTRKSLGGQFTEQNETSESLYLSFQESPSERDSVHQSSPIAKSNSKNVHNSHSNSDHSLLNEFSANNSSAELPEYTDNPGNNVSAEVSAEEKKHGSSQPVNNNSRVNAFADARDTPGRHNAPLNGHEVYRANNDSSAIPSNESKLSPTPDDHYTNSASGASLVEDDDNIESTQSENEDSSWLPSTDSPKTKVIDLTQSDSSLQNSPVGATRQQFVNQRDIAVIVGELSAVNNDVMVKQTLLDTININTLPDKGRNLMNKVAELQKRKSELEDELHSNEEYSRQKKGLEQMQNKVPVSATKQTTLNFENLNSKLNDAVRSLDYETKNIKPEPNQDYRSFNSVDDDFSPESKPSLAPSWGDLPKPDMTISGFGKKAMQTHLAEKALTLDALSSLHQALKSCPTEETVAEDPRNLKVELMPHQKHGLAWMLWREQERPSGGILADDMGLGKTISMISLILKSQELKEESENDSNDTDSDSDSPQWMSKKYSRMPKGGTLVVCPASLMNQWEREILKRVKRRALSVELYHGPKRETKPRRLANYDVIITTYNLVSRESGIESAKNATVKRDQGPLFLIKWNRIILDEAHMVRNHKSQMALGVCELTGKHRWCLTGTPIQNKELDLYALLKFLRCSPFDDLTVWKRWVDNKNAAGMQRLNTMMKSLMLRRTKEQLHAKGDLDCLPAKFYERIDIHLDPEELVIYEKVAIFSSTLFAQFLSQRAEKQQALDVRYGISSKPAWEQQEGPDNQFVTTEELAKMHRKFKGIQDIKTHQILVLLLRLRQICNHPGLVKKMVEDGDLDMGGPAEGVEDNSGLDVDLFNQMNKLNISESNIEDVDKEDLNKSVELSVDNPVLDFQRPSAKVRAILDLIQEKIADTDDKAIIVSQWTSMLNIISPFLKDLKIKFDSLTGEVPVDKRQEIVNEFNKPHSGPQILLLSLTAGGVGLNLIGANHLILVDIHWNPQLENQACDRIYRVGQKKDVNIYRLITINTIEERIKSLQDYKLSIADSVLTGTRNTQTSKLTLDDLKMLFSVPAPSQPLPDEQHMPPAR